MLRSKLLLILGMAMVFLGLTAGSMAYFTSKATSTSNKISAGTMYIGDENEERGVVVQSIELTDLVPGEPETVKVTVKNLGTMPTYLSGISAVVEEENDMFIANALKTICSYQENKLFEGSLLALDGSIVSFSQPIRLEPEEIAELDLEIGLDIRVGNWYKGKDINYSITIHALQEPEQEIAGWAIIADESNYEEKIKQAQPSDIILLSAGKYDEIRLNASITLKAKDLVYDVVVDKIIVDDVASGESLEESTRIQGITLNVDTNSFAIKVNKSENLIVSDNIIFSKGIAINGGDEKSVLVTRNDMTGVTNKSSNPGANSPKFVYNLGLDLDPEEHAF